LRLHGVVDEFKHKGFNATIEGGGAAIPFIAIYLKNGNVVVYVDFEGVWGGQVYDSQSVFSMGGDPSSYFDVSAKTEDSAEEVVRAFLTEVFIDVPTTSLIQ
jgi:hypothetical protein